MRLTGKPLELTLSLIKRMKDDPEASVSIEVAMSLVDTIEALQQENEQLQKERDAAIADIKYALSLNAGCPICKHWNKANPKLPWCNSRTCEFEWRGLEGEGI